MGQIIIESTPASVQQMKANIAARNTTDNPFSLLRRPERGPGQFGPRLGGDFALPGEFDTTKWAAGFYLEGSTARQMEADQTILGTEYVADGWKVWKYPETSGKVSGNDDEGKPIFEPHPLAGQPHKVSEKTKDGGTFVLMCRPIEVQEQVNHAYGAISRESLDRETAGESLSVPDAANDPGMLTEQVLKGELGAERDYDESQGHTTVVHSELPGRGTRRLTKREQKVSR